MWYDTMCSDDPDTVIIRTEFVNNIYDFDLDAGTVMIEAGVTFFQLADFVWRVDRFDQVFVVGWEQCRPSDHHRT